ncbi:hypothetical protein [Trabulsiella guamensis]|uniref:hypothetical protein n=1 Tax=Trabulsiella guamensis TaxID=158852 RepID=UPI0005708283|nr:hypothetical protein [Trabulsiella guamensis]
MYPDYFVGLKNSLELIENSQLLQLSLNRGKMLSTQTYFLLTSHTLTPKEVAASDDIQIVLVMEWPFYQKVSDIYILPSGVNLFDLEDEYTTWQTSIDWHSRIKSLQ